MSQQDILIETDDTKLPSGFVYLNDVCASIKTDIKYATSDNFTGDIITGYKKPIAIMTEDSATALTLVQQELQEENLGLLVWDAYRPARAVEFFAIWRDLPDNSSAKAVYYPNLDKDDLFNLGFIGYGKSAHSRGSTIDLTIIDQSGRALDMGSGFDFFDNSSSANAINISDQAKNNRMKLNNLMIKHGFEGIDAEWWHFTLRDEPFPNKYFDFIVQ